jgi:hypothetical protein
MSEILGFDSESVTNLQAYKDQFSEKTVQLIHEAVLEAWPPDCDIDVILGRNRNDVSGLYIGDYGSEYIARGIVRHSIYANKILIVDPFIYAPSVRDKFNPILNPKKHRSQTLRNANFWFRLYPWINAGIVEIIRTPADFDANLNWTSLERQERKFETNEKLKAAADASAKELIERHGRRMQFQQMILGAPDAYLSQVFGDLRLEKEDISFDQFLSWINSERAKDPDVLGPASYGKEEGQLHIVSSGASYDVAQLTSTMTNSYLVTDLAVRWLEISMDREHHNSESKIWSPFAKSLQGAPLRYLNNLELDHALKLRSQGRLERMRAFLMRVWKTASIEALYDDANARLFAEELSEQVRMAEEEWKTIDHDLVKVFGGEVVAGLLAAGPLIASGSAAFLGAAAVAVGATTLAAASGRRRRFPDKFPAAFFMNIASEP